MGNEGVLKAGRRWAVDFRAYKYAEGSSMPERMAHALDWAAARYPKQWLAYNIVLQAVMGYTHTPSGRNKEIAGLRGRLGRAREILRVKYGRGLLVDRDMGCRGTVDSEDALKTAVVRASARYSSSSVSLAKAASLVEIATVKPTAENKPWISWWNGTLQGQLRLLQSPDFLKKLLPPGES